MIISKGRFAVNIFFSLFSICLTFLFDSELRNIGLLLFMAASFVVFLFYKKVIVSDALIISIIVVIIFFCGFVHEETRWSSVLYTCIFLLAHLCFLRCLYISNYTVSDLKNIVRMILLAYFLVLLMQQVSVVLGLPVINNFGVVTLANWKFNSLALEPSWAGRIVGLLMYVYLRCSILLSNKHISFKDSLLSDRLVWFGFLWCSLTTFSGTAILFMLVIFSFFIDYRKYLLQSMLLIICLYAIISFFDVEQFNRIFHFSYAVLSLEPEAIIEADHSASYRVVPFILAFEHLDLVSFTSWFGHGVDYTASIDCGLGTPAGAGILTFVLDYGYIPSVIYILFTMRSCIDVKYPSTIVFWFLLVMLYGINFQIPWLTIMLLWSLKLVSQNIEQEKGSI